MYEKIEMLMPFYLKHQEEIDSFLDEQYFAGHLDLDWHYTFADYLIDYMMVCEEEVVNV